MKNRVNPFTFTSVFCCRICFIAIESKIRVVKGALEYFLLQLRLKRNILCQLCACTPERHLGKVKKICTGFIKLFLSQIVKKITPIIMKE